MVRIPPRLIYYTTVFLTGAAVLIFEVSAVRLLAPYFGASLYVLSSVLSVILAALSLGYYFGGRLADRMPHFMPLYFIIGAGGILMLFLILAGQFLIPSAASLLSITSGPLILSMTFFLVPAFLLGIDSPFVIRILTESTTNHKQQGAIVGSVFFWSTVGSIIGSISAGFVLIPQLGLTLTIAGTAIVLIIWSILAATILQLQSQKPERLISHQFLLTSIIFTIFITGILSFQLYQFTPPQPEDIVTRYYSDGYYSSINIFDRNINGTEYRFYKGDSSNMSAIQLYNPNLVFEYAQTITIAEILVPDAKNILVLGGGTYTLPRYMHATNSAITIDVVELEPELFALAHTYFELPITEKITSYTQDGRVFLQSTSTLYDIIFSDVFNSGSFIPPHLSTIEAYQAIKNRLSPRGIGLINVMGALHNNGPNLTDSLIKSIATVFPNYKMIGIDGPTSTDLQNIMIIVRHDDVPFIIPETVIKPKFTDTIIPVQELVVNDYIPNSDSPLLFDNKNATERLLARQIKQFKR